MADERRQKVSDAINSFDVDEDEKQKLYDFSVSLMTIIDQYPGSSKDKSKILEEFSQRAEKHDDEGVVDDTPEHDKLSEILTHSISLINIFHEKDSADYHNNMKAVAIPINVMLVEKFKGNDLAKEEHGEVITDFLEKIFVEYYRVGDGDKCEVVHPSRREKNLYGNYGTRVRETLPHNECYKLISILYETYQEIGQNDLTSDIEEAIVKWLVENQVSVKSVGKE